VGTITESVTTASYDGADPETNEATTPPAVPFFTSATYSYDDPKLPLDKAINAELRTVTARWNCCRGAAMTTVTEVGIGS
jgi:hypothetical protein